VICHDLTIVRIELSNFHVSKQIITPQIESPAVFKLRYESQARLGFAIHCYNNKIIEGNKTVVVVASCYDCDLYFHMYRCCVIDQEG